MARERCAIFHGRETILDKIADYLQRKDKSPLTVYGPSGSGKTSIIAEAARKVSNILLTYTYFYILYIYTPKSFNLFL